MKDLYNLFDEHPDRRIWDRLEEKLDKKASMRKLRFYRVASFAAMITALVAAVSYFDHMLDDHNPHLFASNEKFTSFVLEEIEYNENGLFNMAFFSEIRNAYAVSKEDETLELSGEYMAVDGEIGFNIFLAKYTYFLEFDYAGFPVMKLISVEGQTLYFTAEGGETLKMNVEPYGLKLIESSFLPEYHHYSFSKLEAI
ncbi:hypothetical protein [Portibacter marinus]|uniref:hypothetical protein n=1 Tax=Portibacter marinus TaxID=2898660 RepID=UPI001F37AB96|nr:hypothetical protein [Portibacter marinus]